MTAINLDEACNEIMKAIRNMANDTDIEQMIVQRLADAYESGYADCANEMEQNEQ